LTTAQWLSQLGFGPSHDSHGAVLLYVNKAGTLFAY
jgi:hypothetical protein